MPNPYNCTTIAGAIVVILSTSQVVCGAPLQTPGALLAPTVAQSNSTSLIHGTVVYAKIIGDNPGFTDIYSCRIFSTAKNKSSEPLKLASVSGYVTSLALQPYGRYVAFISDEAAASSKIQRSSQGIKPHTLGVMTVFSGIPKQIHLDGNITAFQWAPDGKSIAVLVDNSKSKCIWIVDPSSMAVTQTGIQDPIEWTWTFDSRNILYTNSKQQLIKQSPFARKPATMWRLPFPNMKPMSSSRFPNLAAGEYSVVQFSANESKAVISSTSKIVPEQVFIAPGSADIAIQTFDLDAPEPDQSSAIALGVERNIAVWSPKTKNLRFPMRWSDAPAYGNPDYHIFGWTADGKHILVLHDIGEENSQSSIPAREEMFALNPDDTAVQNAGGKPQLSPSIFSCDGSLTSIDWRDGDAR